MVRGWGSSQTTEPQADWPYAFGAVRVAGPSSQRTPSERVQSWGSLHSDLQQLSEGGTGGLVLLMH